MQQTNVQDFITAYIDSGCDVTATATRLHVARATVYNRVRYLRKAGVKLPMKRRSGKSYNVAELNKFIKELKDGSR